MRKVIDKYLVFASVFLLAACGGGGGNAFLGAGSGGNGSVGDVNVSLGSGFNPFQEGLIEISQSTISAGGSTVIGVRVVQDDGTPFVQSSLSASFSSPCSAQNKGKFSQNSGGSSANSFEFNDEGAINIVYTDEGCSASGAQQSNVITAKVVVENGELQATGTVTIQPGSAGSILLVEPTSPTELALNGGVATPERPQSANVRFRVVDDTGSQAPVQGQLVCFELNTDVGGITLTPSEATTGADGLASTSVRSGNVSTPVIVTASVAGPEATSSCGSIPSDARVTQNDNIVISTGLPDQDGFTVFAETLNPEAFDLSNVPVTVTVSVNDLFNNPVRDGVAISFTTEGATIDDQCTTVDGVCSVTWTSNGDRPFDGRTTVTAFTVGEESFVDVNGNGVYDADINEPYDDRPEPLFDADENDTRSNGLKCPGETNPAAPKCLEEFEDFNSNSSFDEGNGAFNGTRCASSCSADNSLFVWDDVVLVMARSDASIVVSPNPVEIPADGFVEVSIEVAGLMPDGSLQKMPKDTSVAVLATTGRIVGPAAFTVKNTNSSGPDVFVVTIEDSGDAENGTLTVTVTAPSGVETAETVPMSQP